MQQIVELINHPPYWFKLVESALFLIMFGLIRYGYHCILLRLPSNRDKFLYHGRIVDKIHHQTITQDVFKKVFPSEGALTSPGLQLASHHALVQLVNAYLANIDNIDDYDWEVKEVSLEPHFIYGIFINGLKSDPVSYYACELTLTKKTAETSNSADSVG